MHIRGDHTRDEALALWRALFDEPAPSKVDGRQLFDLIVAKLPEVDYRRLTSAAMAQGLVFPRAER